MTVVEGGQLVEKPVDPWQYRALLEKWVKSGLGLIDG